MEEIKFAPKGRTAKHLFKIVKDGHIVNKGFQSVEEAKKWGVWNYKGDTNFDVVSVASIKERAEKLRAAKKFLNDPPEVLEINGFKYRRL